MAAIQSEFRILYDMEYIVRILNVYDFNIHICMYVSFHYLNGVLTDMLCEPNTYINIFE